MPRRLHIMLAMLSATLWFGAAAQQPARTGSTELQPGRGSVDFDSQDETNRILERYDSRFEVMDSLVFRMPADTLASVALDYAEIDFIVKERVEAIDEAVDAQIREMKARTGLDIRGQAYVRPGNQISYDPDDPLVAYNAKLQAELEWNIFHSSLYKRATKIRELQLEGELRQLEYERDALAETIFRQKRSVRYRYYGRLLTVLGVHAENLRLLMQTQIYLLRNGKISSDDLLKVINEQAEVERQLIAIKSDSIVTPLPANVGIAYIKVADTASLMQYIREEHRDVRKLAMREELLGVQRKKTDYLQTMDILPFARVSYYNRPNVHNTHNIDVGLSFKIPISAETARKRRAIRAEQSVVRIEQQRTCEQIEREVTALLRDIENYNENIYGEYERMVSLKSYIAMRKEGYRNVAGEYSRIDRLQEYNVYLQAWERMLTYAYQRDCQLMELQSYLSDEPVSRYLIIQEMK